MGDIWTADKLELFLVFFLPGFISLKIFDLIVPNPRRDFSKSLLEAIGYSALNFAALSWLILILLLYQASYKDHLALYSLGIAFILFIMPVIWPILLRQVLCSSSLSKYFVNPIQTP